MSYAAIVNSFRSKNILIVGDIILDHYIFGKVNRISPEAPVPVVDVARESFMLGGAANVANNIIALGGNAAVAGIIGKDRAGDVVRRLLTEAGIGCEGLVEDDRPTTVKTRVIAHNQQVVRFDREDSCQLDGKPLALFLEYIRRALPRFDAVIISDYRKGVINAALVNAIVRFAGQRDTFVAVDPKVGHFDLYKKVSIITPNIMEASQGSGIEISDEKSLVAAGRTLLSKLACRSVLITRGEEGMSLFERDGRGVRITHIPTAAVRVFDVTGAGDTVIAAFTLAHAAGASLHDAAIISNHAAGIVVGEVGAAVASPDRLLGSLKQHN
jgi:D-beta-D-heptose 7-phosphate kinase/D-beta-D-heptose 1-phosphate adenosyltransferase